MMGKNQTHKCKDHLEIYFRLKQKSVDVIKLRGACKFKDCGRSFTLIYLLEKLEEYDG